MSELLAGSNTARVKWVYLECIHYIAVACDLIYNVVANLSKTKHKNMFVFSF
jgi:hypothetical protein